MVDKIFDFLYYILKLIMGASFWIVVAFVGVLLFRNLPTPFELIIGLPLYLAGAGLTINNIVVSILRTLRDRKSEKERQRIDTS